MHNYSNESSFELEITDIDSRGRGVSRLQDGRVVFVPNALLGERVQATLLDQKKSFVIAKLQKVLQSSSQRIQPICSQYYNCGGCTLQQVSYPAQLDIKTKLVASQLRRIGGLNDIEVRPCQPSPDVFGYRNKATFKLECINNQLRMGFFEEESHCVIDTSCCHICSQGINKAAKLVREFIIEQSIPVYQSGKSTPSINSVMIRELAGSVLVLLTATDRLLLKVDSLAAKLSESFGAYGIFLSIEGRGGAKHLLGAKRISSSTNGIHYSVSPSSFLQVNNKVAQRLFDDALAHVNNNDIVIDAYSGIGIMSALFAQKAKTVYSVEIVKEACEDQKHLLAKNNLENVMVMCGDCTVLLPDLLRNLRQSKAQTTVTIDPPRKGCSQQVISSLLTAAPDRIIYISCDTATLARDLRSLSACYQIHSITPYDMFPSTANVETLVLLERRRN